jgi:hypothetical protein
MNHQLNSSTNCSRLSYWLADFSGFRWVQRVVGGLEKLAEYIAIVRC